MLFLPKWRPPSPRIFNPVVLRHTPPSRLQRSRSFSKKATDKRLTPDEIRLKAVPLLRALLREASYLPDSTARTCYRSRILSQYNKYPHGRNWYQACRSNDPEKGTLREQFLDGRSHRLLQNGQLALKQLRRANEGHRKPLLHVLLVTYGRTGKRRALLLNRLAAVKCVGDPALYGRYHPLDTQQTIAKSVRAELELVSEDIEDDDSNYLGDGKETAAVLTDDSFRTNVPGHVDTATSPDSALVRSADDPIHKKLPRLHPTLKQRNPFMPPLVLALLDSQRKTRIPPDGPPAGARFKSFSYDMPSHNIWLRPLPQKRASNIARKQYVRLVRAALPPLPTVDYERLRELTYGERREDIPQRRPRAGSADGQPSKGPSALDVILSIDRDKPIKRPFMPGIRGFGVDQPHCITHRYMARLYARVFAATCRMTWNAKSEQWVFEWGKPPVAQRSKATRKVPQAMLDTSTGLADGSLGWDIDDAGWEDVDDASSEDDVASDANFEELPSTSRL